MSYAPTNRIARVGIVILALAALTLVIIPRFITLATEPPQPMRIEEDDPRWDCATMGNRVCGLPMDYSGAFAEANCPEGMTAIPAPEFEESGAMECAP